MEPVTTETQPFQIKPSSKNPTFSTLDSLLLASSDPSPSPSPKLLVFQINTIVALTKSPTLQSKLFHKLLSCHRDGFLLLILGHHAPIQSSLTSNQTATENQGEISSIGTNSQTDNEGNLQGLKSTLEFLSTNLPVPFHAAISTQNNHFSPPCSNLFKHTLRNLKSSLTFDSKASVFVGDPLPEDKLNTHHLSPDHKFAVNCGLSFKTPSQFLSLEEYRSEKEKMLAGELYNASDQELKAMRLHARQLFYKYNSSLPDEDEKRQAILKELLGECSKGTFIEPNFKCDYGSNIFVGENLYMNFDCTFLDVARITIGDNVMMAPGVQLYTAYHPADDVKLRISGAEYGSPIVIGDNVWFGGGVIVLPGVSIGDNTTIGAGSVVTKNIPEKVVAAGNPCKVIREIKE